jgi:hypothetical protein
MTGIFAVLDDISILMQDTAVMAKVAAKKTAGVLGDDLAVGAEQASGFKASRELPVIFSITKGSFINKLIILPFAFLMSYFAPFLIVPILLIGGTYLAFEGAEKIIHTFFIKHDNTCSSDKCPSTSIEEEFALEQKKISSAIKTDFILSIEIIMIALGTVSNESLSIQILIVSLIAFLATIGVYGLVALMVRMDDLGLKMIEISDKKKKGFIKIILLKFGLLLVSSLPVLIKLLSIIGTIAMILVGGGMFVHNIHQIHDFLHFIPIMVSEFVVGLVVGFITYFVVEFFILIRSKLN